MLRVSHFAGSHSRPGRAGFAQPAGAGWLIAAHHRGKQRARVSESWTRAVSTRRDGLAIIIYPGISHRDGPACCCGRTERRCCVDGYTDLVPVVSMTSITSKELHEQTGAFLDRVKQGQRFRVLRGGEADALLVPVSDQIDPPWDDIMTEVRKARSQGKPLRANPIVGERNKRHHAARVHR